MWLFVGGFFYGLVVFVDCVGYVFFEGGEVVEGDDVYWFFEVECDVIVFWCVG